MPVGAIIAIVIAVVVVAAAAVLAGPPVWRAAAPRLRAVRLNIRPLTPEQHTRFDRAWTAAQERFIDGPGQAAQRAAELVIAVARDRGYSVGDEEKLLCELSVRHARQLPGYRRARETTERLPDAATEELRQAMIGYRAMFRGLLGKPETARAMPEPKREPERVVVDTTREEGRVSR